MMQEDTICALATPSGSGAIGVIRLSGPEAFSIASKVFKGKKLEEQKTQSLLFGELYEGEELIDEVLLSLFKAPHSYTGENVVEISCHGSSFILQRVLALFIAKGARLANPGEYTMRAYMNGKMDLAQAEAVADLIASESKAAHSLAMNQMRGGFSEKIAELRQELIQFTALIELELDFAEEDVEFADRKDLKDLVANLLTMIGQLTDSFATGNVLKNGIPVAIVGEPNVGKSTLLNALLNENKAIVSDIAGTTRDSIEDEVKIGGVSFRFIDTAGIRETEDTVELMGIQRTYAMVEKAMIVLLLLDATQDSSEQISEKIQLIQERIGETEKQLLVIANKMDKGDLRTLKTKFPEGCEPVFISALKKEGMDDLLALLQQIAREKMQSGQEVTVSNVRHYQALQKAGEALQRVADGLEQNITGDFLAMDIRQALHFLGEITGSIDIDRDILGTIFSQFCIGK
jgi:tRNA modification GTPase